MCARAAGLSGATAGRCVLLRPSRVKRDATEQEINKAYKKLAVKYHPDKNPGDKALAEENFKKVCEAYEVLSNKEKRQTYDQFGRQGLNSSGMGGGGFSRGQAEEIFARSSTALFTRSAPCNRASPCRILPSQLRGYPLVLARPARNALPLPCHLTSAHPCLALPFLRLCTPTSQNSSVARIRSACSSARWARAACPAVAAYNSPLAECRAWARAWAACPAAVDAAAVSPSRHDGRSASRFCGYDGRRHGDGRHARHGRDGRDGRMGGMGGMGGGATRKRRAGQEPSPLAQRSTCTGCRERRSTMAGVVASRATTPRLGGTR